MQDVDATAGFTAAVSEAAQSVLLRLFLQPDDSEAFVGSGIEQSVVAAYKGFALWISVAPG